MATSLPPHPHPDEWEAIIEESDADLAAGRIVDGDALLRELRATIAEMEQEQQPQPTYEGRPRP